MKLPQDDLSNSPIILIQTFKLLLDIKGNNRALRGAYAEQLVTQLYTIFRSKARAKMFMLLVEHGAATAPVIEYSTGMAEASVYYNLKELRKLGLVVKTVKAKSTKVRGTGGPRPNVWALPNATAEQVAKALVTHYRAESPKWRVAEKVVQQLLTERPTEIKYSELVQLIRKVQPQFMVPDLAQLATTMLHEQGVKVWR